MPAPAPTTAAPLPAADSCDEQVRALFTTRTRPRTSLAAVLSRAALPCCAALAIAVVVGVGRAGFVPASLDVVFAVAVFALVAVACARVSELTRYPAELLLVPGAALLTLGIAANAQQVALAPIALVAGAALAGFALSRGVERLTWTLPIAAFASWSDAHSFAHGPTSTLFAAGAGAPDAAARHTASLLQLVLVRVPTPHGSWYIGSVDVLVVALLVGVSFRHSLPMPRTVVALTALFAASAIYGQPVPLIPLLCGAFVVVHARRLLVHAQHALRAAGAALAPAHSV